MERECHVSLLEVSSVSKWENLKALIWRLLIWNLCLLYFHNIEIYYMSLGLCHGSTYGQYLCTFNDITLAGLRTNHTINRSILAVEYTVETN